MSVGKSSIIYKFITNNFNPKNTSGPTVGVKNQLKKVEVPRDPTKRVEGPRKIELDIWDTAGESA